MECKLYIVESLELDAYNNNFIINNKTKRFCGVNQLWAFAETVMVALEKQKLRRAPPRLGINRLCSAAFEQLLAFWATLCSTSNLGQLLPSLATFEQQIDIKPIQTIKGRFISKDFIKTGFIKTDFIKTKDIQ